MVEQHEPHPFGWYLPSDAQTLIIGTFPPVRSRWAYAFFYPNRLNLFWKVMAAIAGREINNNSGDPVGLRRAILDELRVGVTDMGGTIYRVRGNSLDENLDLIEHMPILRVLDEGPAIDRIILTSSSGKVSALSWFRLYLQNQNIPHVLPKGPKPLQFQIKYGSRSIDVFVLYSPSPRAANRISFGSLVEMYKKVILRDK